MRQMAATARRIEVSARHDVEHVSAAMDSSALYRCAAAPPFDSAFGAGAGSAAGGGAAGARETLTPLASAAGAFAPPTPS